MNGIRLGIYGLIEVGGYLRTVEGGFSFVRSVVVGVLVGVMGVYLGSFIYMVRRRVLFGVFRVDFWCRVGVWVFII